MRARAGVLWALALATAPNALGGQSLGLNPDRDLPDWMQSWSPLALQGDLPRRLPSASSALPLLLLPLPRVGLFWTAGNPAALPAEVADTYADFQLALARQDGAYRRPLDPGQSMLAQVSTLAWGRVGTAGAMIGRVVVDRETLDPGTQADVTDPYATSPFFVTDTFATAQRRTRARLEGAAGWELGRYALGGALGYETLDNATVQGGVARRSRRVVPALAIGATRSLGAGGVRLGVHARWRGAAETVDLVELTALTRVYEVQGSRESSPIDLLRAPYYRRIEESAPSAGVAAGGSWGALQWILFGEVARLHQRLWRQQQDNPPLDRWDTRAWTVGGALERPLGARGLLVVELRRAALSGDGGLAFDSLAVSFTAVERAFTGSVGLQLLPAAGRWVGLARLSVVNERRERADSMAQRRSVLETLTPGLALEAGGPVSDALFLSVGYARGAYQAKGEIPLPSAQGPFYQRLIAPELDLESGSAAPQALSVATRWQVRGGAAVWLSGRWESLAPGNRQLSFGGISPTGTRTARSLTCGVTLGATPAPAAAQ
ncbi:MAG TPA: hypothetical protein VH137_08335 [Gemmatimonadales bacterium]|nr:hypothetical protein [Gemmatimonadales bacterium]